MKIVAQDLKILLAHTEAGVRSSHVTVEQKIRSEIDKMANYNFCPVPQAVENLKKEGIVQGVYFVGDTLYDTFLKERECFDFVFVTIHRRENIEDKKRLSSLIDSLKEYNRVVFPVHPHTEEMLKKYKIDLPDNVTKLAPLTHKETMKYIKDAKLVLTDSGGVEREAFWSGTPVKVARPDTEWSDYTGAFGNGHAGDMIRQILETKRPYRSV